MKYSSIRNATKQGEVIYQHLPIRGVEGDYLHTKSPSSKQISCISREVISERYASGIQVINPKIINEICKDKIFYRDEISFKEIWDKLITKGQLYKSDIETDSWYSVDTMEQLKKAEDYK